MLFGSTLMALGYTNGSNSATVYVDPPVIHNEDLAVMDFTVTIEVMDVIDLWGWGCTVRYEPLTRVIKPIEVEEGTFLDEFATRPVEADRITYFTYSIDNTEGAIHIGCTLLNKIDPYTGEPVPSVSGSGTIATVTFLVMEAGSSLIELKNTKLIDSGTNLIPHGTGKGHYFGPDSEMQLMKVSDPKVNVGETVSLISEARNFGKVPLYTKIKFDLMREDKLYTFWNTRRPLTASDPSTFWGWTGVGTSPYLNLVDGNYIQSSTYCSTAYYITFESLPPLQPGELITGVTLDAYCWASAPETDVDIDVYLFLPSYGVSWYYLGAFEPYAEWSWIYLDHTLEGILEDPGTGEISVDRINDLEAYIHYMLPSGTPDLVKIDAMKLTVDVVPRLQPKEKREYDPFVFGPFSVADVGKYYGTATCWFSYGGERWNVGSPPRTFKFEVQN